MAIAGTGAVFWGIHRYETREERRLANEILQDWTWPIDVSVAKYAGRPVADLLERAEHGLEWEREQAVEGLAWVFRGYEMPTTFQDWSREDVERRVIKALVDSGYECARATVLVPVLARALRDSSAKVRVAAAWTLYWIGGAASGACAALRECLRDSDQGVRLIAARALYGMRFEIDGPLSVATAALQDPDAGIRGKAVENLLEMAADVPQALAALRDAGAQGNLDAASLTAISRALERASHVR